MADMMEENLCWASAAIFVFQTFLWLLFFSLLLVFILVDLMLF